jgi:DNA-binding NtrC family response regulator
MDNFSRDSLTTSPLGEKALIISRDREVAHELQSYLQRELRCQTELATTYFTAEQRIRDGGRQSVFIDLRPEQANDDPASLLGYLARQDRRTHPVVSLGCDGYRCEWADIADSTVSAHLRLPLDTARLRRILTTELAESLKNKPASPIDSRQVETTHIKYKTYTPQMFQILEHLARVAAHDVTILLVGETGTGKTTVARMVHEMSSRANEVFLALACGALPPELIESEVFGHVRGSFTGAERNKEGKFEVADPGTLLLDEIDCLNQNQQMKLLRVIETGEFERVGSNETIKTNARLIAASNVDLKTLVEQGTFRPDLYYRLSVLEFKIPPLRDRPFDIVPMTMGFIDEFRVKHGITIQRIHPEFLQRLRSYHWPGNIRELKNHIGRAVLFSHDGQLTPSDLAPALLESTEHDPTLSQFPQGGNTLSDKVANAEQELLTKALEEHGNNRTATAKSLGISRVGLYKKMKKYGMIEPRVKRSGVSAAS